MADAEKWRKMTAKATGLRVNTRENTVFYFPHMDGERYVFDFELCRAADGWSQYDTKQDAWYFGCWVHTEGKLIVTYAEGDLTLVACASRETFISELKHMEEFYGPPPPAAVAFDADGTRTEYYDTRPTGEAE